MKVDTTYIQQVRNEHDYMEQIYEKPKHKTEIAIPQTVATSSDFAPIIKTVGMILGIVIIGALVWAIVRKYNLFSHEASDRMPKSMGEDTIYNHKWKDEINEANKNSRYDEVAVLCYLYWLSRLNDDGVIIFSVAKTPGIFLQETERYAAQPHDDENGTPVPVDASLVSNTRKLTNHYLRVRYGHKHVSADQARDIMTIVEI